MLYIQVKSKSRLEWQFCAKCKIIAAVVICSCGFLCYGLIRGVRVIRATLIGFHLARDVKQRARAK